MHSIYIQSHFYQGVHCVIDIRNHIQFDPAYIDQLRGISNPGLVGKQVSINLIIEGLGLYLAGHNGFELGITGYFEICKLLPQAVGQPIENSGMPEQQVFQFHFDFFLAALVHPAAGPGSQQII